MADVDEKDIQRRAQAPTREKLAEQLADGLEMIARGKIANERWDHGPDFDLQGQDYFAEVVLIHADALRRTPWDAIKTSDDHRAAERKRDTLWGDRRRFSIQDKPGKRVETKTVPHLATRRQLLQAATLAVEAADLLSSVTCDNLSNWGQGIGPRAHELADQIEDLLVSIGRVLVEGPDEDGFYRVGEETGEVWVPEDAPALTVVQ